MSISSLPPLQQQQVEEEKGSEAYHNFIIHLSNALTRRTYRSRLRKYFEYCRVGSYDKLLFDNNQKIIQSNIKDFLVHIQTTEGLSSATARQHITAIKFFYEMNDITLLNWKKINLILKPFRKAVDDRPYSREEIARILEKCDQRGKIVILLCCSAGLREGAIHSLKIAHLQKISDIYKISVYKNEPEEYTALCSSECAKMIDQYLEYRKRYGEVIQSSSPLIREQFNKNNPESAAHSKHLTIDGIEHIIYRAVNDAGIREKKIL